MAVLKPFKAHRPAPDLADKVAALPYDVMNSQEAREVVKGNPYSFLHVDKSEVDLPEDIDIHDEKVYEKARDNLYQMIKDGVFIQDNEDSFYIYKQVMNGRPQVGLVGTTSIDDYLKDVIKKHEFTRADKEEDRINHVDYTNANTGPIFLTYRKKEEISDLINGWMKENDPIYDFTSDDEITHTIWKIHDRSIIEKLVSMFASVDYLYIADGHHRTASAVKVGLKRREQFPDYDGTEEFNFFLSVLFPDEDLYIMDYNRVVRDLNEYSTAEFIELLKENFDVEQYTGEGQYKPTQKHSFGMFLDDNWYILKAKEGSFDKDSPVDRLDVSILQKNVLTPLLGIMDPRVDSRIDFVGGIRGLAELEERVLNGMRIAFSMYPTSIDDLMAIADAGEVMPPKSTWFEPKLRSGLFVHTLD
ncbi:DUF1015 domain-containing protein [Gudongella sp. SC589]|uniref:DUF1015 domain-containing protein n=1 Tax=Gudongella sp. SC589 TaxID=3385990 RepID=UPI003904D3E1